MSRRVAETILANACAESRKYFIRRGSRFHTCLPFYRRIYTDTYLNAQKSKRKSEPRNHVDEMKLKHLENGSKTVLAAI